MISPEKAQKLLINHCRPLGEITIPIEDSLGHILAQDVRAPIPLPRFDNSAMDGFAVRSNDTITASADSPARLRIVESIYAGDVSRRTLRSGEACRIMTGAPVPRGADAVAQKEEAAVESETVVIDHPIAPGRHIRHRGEEIGKGTILMTKGLAINPGAVGCLATAGLRRVRVSRRPTVSLIVTGDETVEPGKKLAPAQIYESNSYTLSAALRQMGMTPVRVRHVGDHPGALRNAVSAALEKSDVLIVTGGISVGDKDYLRATLGKLRVREVFWRVKQKPGKPFYFGVKGKRKFVFGLPGNPASVFTCFYVYVYPALRRLAGHGDTGLPESELPLGADVASDDVRWRILKAKTLDDPVTTVHALPRQASHMISSLTEIDSLIVVPPGVGRVAKGTVMKTYRLPTPETVLK
jgi:molybdopterin molybdotransferase